MASIFKPKFFTLLKAGISKETIKKDLFAGTIVGIVAIPLSIAFAVASGVSPEKGLITAIFAGFFVSLFGGSRIMVAGPTGAMIIVIYGIIQQYGFDGLVISSIIGGLILILFGLFRLGSVLKYIPRPLMLGFNSAIAVLIFSTQIKDAFGLNVENIPSGFLNKWAFYFTNIHTFNYVAVGLTIVTILITVYSKKITSKIPGLFLAIVVVTGISTIFNLPVSTIKTVFGNIPVNIHLSIPNFDFANITDFIKPGFTIAILGAMVSLLTAVVADGMIGGKHRSNTELIAQGIANIITPLFGGIPATGAIARTATSVKNGGRTPIAGMFHAVVILLIMLVFGRWAMLIPMSCLAGILIVVSYNMSEWRSFRSILKGSKYDGAVLLSTFLLTIL
ncbi:MAG: sodium-independent anion transporter, partial [Bacteroidales bacterium]|nr:sodium-independent anion transporter [Bacteroidales bacterium]